MTTENKNTLKVPEDIHCANGDDNEEAIEDEKDDRSVIFLHIQEIFYFDATNYLRNEFTCVIFQFCRF
jgi:hypothetical protein